MKILKFFKITFKAILLLLIFTVIASFFIMIKYQNYTVPMLFEEAKTNFFVLVYLLSGGLIWAWLDMVLFRFLHGWIVLIMALIGLALCGLCLIKAKFFFRIFVFVLMIAIVGIAIYAFINGPKGWDNIFDSTNTPSSTASLLFNQF